MRSLLVALSRLVVVSIIASEMMSAGGAAIRAEAGYSEPDWELSEVAAPIYRLVLSGGVVYALAWSSPGGASELWRGERSGAAWQPIALPMAQVDDLAAHPTDPHFLYVAGTGGVYRSADGGATWIQVLAGRQGSRGLRVVVSAAEAAFLYAVTGDLSSADLWRSSDAGTSWERLRSQYGGGFCVPTFPVIAPDPLVRERVYVSSFCSSGRTTAAGLTVSNDRWATDGTTILRPAGEVRQDDVLSVLYPQAAVFEPAGASGIVLARRDPRVGGSLLLRTDDGSQHWHALLDYPAPYILGAVPGLPDVQLGGLAVELPALQRLFVGLSKDGRGVLGSEDGGMTWGSVGARDIGAVSALVYNPEADILYAGTGSGLWRMTSPHPR